MTVCYTALDKILKFRVFHNQNTSKLLLSWNANSRCVHLSPNIDSELEVVLKYLKLRGPATVEHISIVFREDSNDMLKILNQLVNLGHLKLGGRYYSIP